MTGKNLQEEINRGKEKKAIKNVKLFNVIITTTHKNIQGYHFSYQFGKIRNSDNILLAKIQKIGIFIFCEGFQNVTTSIECSLIHFYKYNNIIQKYFVIL